jgi:hypothetical protein
MSLRPTIALLAVSIALVAAAPAGAHVIVESDFRGPLTVGATPRLATLTVINEDPANPDDPEGQPFTVCNRGECGSSEGITLVPSCATQTPGGQCTAIDPGVFSISSTATGAANSTCPGMQFTVTEISPGKLSFNPATPGEHIVLFPEWRCRIEFAVDVLKAPATDARADLAGIQTAQVTGVLSTEDLQTGTPVPDLGSNSVTFIPPPTPPRPTRPTIPLTPAPAADTTAPVLSALSLSPTRFRSAALARSITAAAPIGTRVHYRLSETAEVRFRVERARRGRRVGGRCVEPAAATRRATRCWRYVRLRGSFTHAGHAGANAFRFWGQLRGRRLAPGRYRLSTVASDSAANTSVRARVRFRIARR